MAERELRLALVVDTFPPLRTSGAIQIRDLSKALLALGHKPTVIVPDSSIGSPWRIDEFSGVEVLRLKSPKLKDVSKLRRALGESVLPLKMILGMRRSPLRNLKWDGVIWYSPTIFFGLFIKRLVRHSNCTAYLIVRDIFPEWAVDMGLLRKGVLFKYFKLIESLQYRVADVIGIQTQANAAYFSENQAAQDARIEVLENWLSPPDDPVGRSTLDFGSIEGRKIIVYAGNMGTAQSLDIVLDLAESCLARKDLGFLFVGRGSEVDRLNRVAAERNLTNVVFHNEIDPGEIPSLYSACTAGLVSLDARHTTHNIPGKFVSYMYSGLPVLALVNKGNDLVNTINSERVGKACVHFDIETVSGALHSLLECIEVDDGIYRRCTELAHSRFSSQAAAQQIVAALMNST